MNSNKKRPTFDSARLSHAYIAGGGLADALAMAAVCSATGSVPCLRCGHCKKAGRHIHPDITVLEKPKGKREIVVDQIRELKKDVIVLPNESAKKAYVIIEADALNSAAQNTLLRMLEEPPPHAVFILKTDSPAALLPTVRSRCVELMAEPDEAGAGSGAVELADMFLDAVSAGDMRLAEAMFLLEKLDKQEFADFLAAARERLAARMRSAAPDGAVGSDGNAALRAVFPQTESLLRKAGEYLDQNVHAGHISGMLCAGLIDIK